MIQTVLLDLDDTLLDFHKAEAVALHETLIQLDIEPKQETIERYSVINAGMWELLEEGKLTREQVLLRRFEQLFSELKIERSGIQAKECYELLLAQGHFFIPGAVELLKELYGQYALYLVSNGTAAVQDGRIKSAGIAPYFKEIFISERMGLHKPQKEFFTYCFERIPGISVDHTIIIGDSLTSDILGGNHAKIHTCWFNPKGKPVRNDIRAEYEVKELREIPPLLKKI